jgi:cytoskeletal protein RodZ
MAGSSLRDPIGVGSALEKARLIRGLTLEEAARDTKLRVDQLSALEREDFEGLPGDAFVRGALRTYAQYLGLRPEKVLAIYGLHTDDPEPPPPPGKLGRVERAIAATRIRDNQRFLLFGAATLVVLLLVFGLVSRDHAAPPPAVISTTLPTPVPTSTSIAAVLVAQRPVNVTIVVDGVEETHAMAEEETLSFTATGELAITVADGGAVQLTVGGVDLGAPGEPGRAWHHTYTADNLPSPVPTPSPGPTVSGSASISTSGTP